MNGVKERIMGVLCGIALCIVIQWAWKYCHRQRTECETACDMVRTVVTDTVRIVSPEDVEGTRTTVGSVVVRAAVIDRNGAYRKGVEFDTFLKGDSCNRGNCFDRDERGYSVDVRLEMTQRVYRDSMYTAWVSGCMPQLDSIEVYRRTERVRISVRERRGRFGLGAVAGVGYARGGIAPFVGIGIYYKLWEF